MIGIINDAVRGYIIDTFGQSAWDLVVSTTEIDKSFVSACPYPDEVTYKAFRSVAEQQKRDLEEVLEECGFYFNTVYIRRMGYDRLLRCMGGNVVEFLQNLNIYHLHLSMSFKGMQPPAFNVDEVTPDSLIFHYASKRPGLTRFAVGLLRGAAKLLYDTEINVTVLRLRDEVEVSTEDGPGGGCGGVGGEASGGSNFDTFLIQFPPQPSLVEQHCTAATCRLSLDPPTLFNLFPFHIVFNTECRLVQVGRALSRMYPGMKPGQPLSNFFTLCHPYIPLNFERILDQSDNMFLLRSNVNGMELKGQMQYLQMPQGYPGDGVSRLEKFQSNFQSTFSAYEPAASGTVGGGVDVGGAASHSGPGSYPFTTSTTPAAAAMAALGAVAEEGPGGSPSMCSAAHPLFGRKAGGGAAVGGGSSADTLLGTKFLPDFGCLPDLGNNDAPPAGASGSSPHPSQGSGSPAATTTASGGSTPCPPAIAACPHLSAMASRAAAASASTRATALAPASASACPHLTAAATTAPPVVAAPHPQYPIPGAAAGASAFTCGVWAAPTPGQQQQQQKSVSASQVPVGLTSVRQTSRPMSRQSSSSGATAFSWHYHRMHPGADLEPVMLFLGSPRIGNVTELRTYGLYVSDLPLFDNSREMVLMAEQRTAEAALKDTFERLSLQLEEERVRSDQLLYQMIPRHIAESLRKGHRVDAETYPEATILFSDIVNFTTIAAGSTALEVCNMLDHLYNEFDALVDKYPSVYKVETIGDAYMLVANVTEPCHDHVDVVLDFALDMQTVCNRVTTNRGVPIQIRVGVHTGAVVGGVVGRKMPRFHLFGDTVNTASRMESHGLAGTVHISAASRALIHNPTKYLITERGEIAVKGKGLMETFLVSRADAPSVAHLRSIIATGAVTGGDLASIAHGGTLPSTLMPLYVSCGSGGGGGGTVHTSATSNVLLPHGAYSSRTGGGTMAATITMAQLAAALASREVGPAGSNAARTSGDGDAGTAADSGGADAQTQAAEAEGAAEAGPREGVEEEDGDLVGTWPVSGGWAMITGTLLASQLPDDTQPLQPLQPRPPADSMSPRGGSFSSRGVAQPSQPPSLQQHLRLHLLGLPEGVLQRGGGVHRAQSTADLSSSRSENQFHQGGEPGSCGGGRQEGGRGTRSAAVSSPRFACESGVRGGVFGGAATESGDGSDRQEHAAQLLSRTTTSVNSDTSTPTRHRRMLVSRRIREPSFYLRAPAEATIGSLDLGGGGNEAMRRMTTCPAELVSPSGQPHPPHPPYRHHSQPPRAPPAGRSDDGSGAVTEDDDGCLVGLTPPLHALDRASHAERFTLLRLPPLTGDLDAAPPQWRVRGGAGAGAAAGQGCREDTSSLPPLVPNMQFELLMPYDEEEEEEEVPVRHRLTRRQEDFDELGGF